MAFIIGDRVKDTSTTTGTGTLTLAASPPTGFRAFGSVLATGDLTMYRIDDVSGNWETGIGTYNSTGPTLARTKVSESSNANALVSFPAGTKTVVICQVALYASTEDDTGSVALPNFGTSVPTTPSGSSANLFSRQIANRKLPAYIGPSGLDSALQPLLARNKVGYWNPPGNATTVPGVFGITAPTVVGTLTARNVATTSLVTRMRRLGFVSAVGAAGVFAEARIAATQFSAGSGSNDGSGFFYVARWVPSDAATVAGKRAFTGLTNSTAAATNVEPNTLQNCIGIAQLSTDATQLYLVYGGSSAQVAVALGATNFPANTLSTAAFELAIFAPNSVANTFYVQLTNIASGAVYTNTLSGSATVVPQSSTLLAPRFWACNNATTLAVALDICSIYVETDT